MSKSGFVELNGVSLFYRVDASATDAPWLVFSNSLLTSSQIWDHQADALRDRFRILRYDHRGHGQSSVPDDPVTFDMLAADLEGLMNHFNIDRCTFVGLSMGVPTGLCLYSRQPGKFERLVLSDGQTKTAPDGHKSWQERIDHAKTVGMDEFAVSVTKRWFAPEFRASEEGKKALAMIAGTPLDGFVACAATLQNYDFDHVVPDVKVPVQLIAGERDGKMPDNMRALCDRFADARFSSVPEAGHIPNLENPAAFTKILSDFLDAQ